MDVMGCIGLEWKSIRVVMVVFGSKRIDNKLSQHLLHRLPGYWNHDSTLLFETPFGIGARHTEAPRSLGANWEETVSSELPKPEHTDYAAMMSVIYSMVKLDYIMQQRIISSLNLKSSSGELESYSLMWSLRPFINNDIMHQAWRLIP
ncbi:hypothetical protein HYC85_020141 [Camellia sinensis]|uniref:Uncharacterized protein n=1 Tax=Camellia sinensis TaxID=4442 RepID=A0A7J7GNX6_CAMSI|nr:hypothetical protein HYC85_020141 [Camellia sinensis]